MPPPQVSGSSQFGKLSAGGEVTPATNPNPKSLDSWQKMKSLEDLFINLLKDIHYAEKQILKALPKMAK